MTPEPRTFAKTKGELSYGPAQFQPLPFLVLIRIAVTPEGFVDRILPEQLTVVSNNACRFAWPTAPRMSSFLAQKLQNILDKRQ